MKLDRRSFLLGSAASLYAAPAVKAVRLPGNPIIRPDMPTVGSNINGPSLIMAPSWFEKPLGRYYLYFASHTGKYIRMAYADRLGGPWKIHEPGVLDIKQTVCEGHIASPDLHIDDAKKEVRMYFHGPLKGAGQRSFLATSKDGVQFTAASENLGESYFRVFRHGGWFYAIANRGQLHRSRDGVTKFEAGHLLYKTPEGIEVRHSAVKIDGDRMLAFHSRIGDNPECILVSTVDLRPEWTKWQASEPQLVLKPELEYEGTDLPLIPSNGGTAKARLRQLRDPAIYREGSKTWLLYSVAGESGLGIAELQ